MNNTKFLSIAALAVALSACGGGGSDSSTEPGSSGTAGNSGVTTPGGTAAVGADKYVGSWVSDCKDSVAVAASAPAVPLKQTITYTFTKVNDTKLSAVQVTNIFPATGCTGPALVTHTNASASNSITIEGTATLDGSSVDKTTVTTGAIGGMTAATTISLNGVVYPGNYFTLTSNTKYLAKITGTAMTFGSSTAVDAQGYPTALTTTLNYTKQ